jgi:uncharacterized SAM-binding protein YcdF (DUF218 family)
VTRLILTVGVLIAVVAGWTHRDTLLGHIGGLVVEQTPLARADVVVLFSNMPRVAAEAAGIQKAGYAPRILVLRARNTPDDDVMRRLGLDPGLEHAIAVQVLRASGVPASVIELLPDAPDGTNEAIRLFARYARSRGITRVIAVTERSHTRRTAYLLRHELGGKGAVIVRAASEDPFRPQTWWQDRDNARELAMEALRWCNSFGLGDWWRARRSSGREAPPDVAPGRRYDARAPAVIFSRIVAGLGSAHVG